MNHWGMFEHTSWYCFIRTIHQDKFIRNYVLYYQQKFTDYSDKHISLCDYLHSNLDSTGIVVRNFLLSYLTMSLVSLGIY